MREDTDKCVYLPSEDEIREACQRIRQGHKAAMKAGKGNHTKRRQGGVRVTSAGTHRKELAAQ
jgi:hypothetical protein